LPYAVLRRPWQWHLLTMLRQTLKTDAIHQWVEGGCRKSPNGLVPNVHKGHVPSQYQSVARYVAQYVVSPPLAVRRIDRYDGQRVTYHDRSHRTDRMEYETVDGATFIGRMVPHTMPKGFQRIRYAGVQATKTFAKIKVIIQAALAKVEGVIKGAVQIIARLTSRQRYEHSTGRDPLVCPHCRGRATSLTFRRVRYMSGEETLTCERCGNSNFVTLWRFEGVSRPETPGATPAADT